MEIEQKIRHDDHEILQSHKLVNGTKEGGKLEKKEEIRTTQTRNESLSPFPSLSSSSHFPQLFSCSPKVSRPMNVPPKIPFLLMASLLLATGYLSISTINVAGVNGEILMMSEDELCQDEIIATRPVRIIADDADLFIGALVNVHEPGPSGFYGCGNITQSGVITFEALNWIAATINQEHGLINGKKVVESFIPGVKIGKKIIHDFHCHFFHSFLVFV